LRFVGPAVSRLQARSATIKITLSGKKIYKKLGWLNELPEDEAERVFFECSRSKDWAQRMTASRPFPMLGQFFDRAELLWTAQPNTASDSRWPQIESRLEKLLER